ncbi:MAG: RidA family protein [Thermodesulfobacteriota bacterium]
MKESGMRKEIVQWVGREFIFISCEGQRIGNAADEMEGIFGRVSNELQIEGLSLDHTIRTRLWAVDRQSRDLASDVRAKYNTGRARAATSSYIMPGYFASEARVGMDLIALRPTVPDIKKIIVESDPPRKPINYLIFDSLLVLAGKTVVLPTLEAQLDEILPRITGILAEAGSSWKDVVNVSCYLHRSQKIGTLKRGLSKWVRAPLARMEIAAVEGYSAEGKLIEIEVTAETHRQPE